MKNNKFLFPHFFKYAGLIIFAISIVLTILELIDGTSIKEFLSQNASISIYSIYATGVLGLVLVTFSKEKQTDEYLESIQVKAFFTSIFIHSFFFFIFSFTNLTLSFINFPAILLMNSILIVYLIFYYIYRSRA